MLLTKTGKRVGHEHVCVCWGWGLGTACLQVEQSVRQANL